MLPLTGAHNMVSIVQAARGGSQPGAHVGAQPYEAALAYLAFDQCGPEVACSKGSRTKPDPRLI